MASQRTLADTTKSTGAEPRLPNAVPGPFGGALKWGFRKALPTFRNRPSRAIKLVLIGDVERDRLDPNRAHWNYDRLGRADPPTPGLSYLPERIVQ